MEVSERAGVTSKAGGSSETVVNIAGSGVGCWVFGCSPAKRSLLVLVARSIISGPGIGGFCSARTGSSEICDVGAAEDGRRGLNGAGVLGSTFGCVDVGGPSKPFPEVAARAVWKRSFSSHTAARFCIECVLTAR